MNINEEGLKIIKESERTLSKIISLSRRNTHHRLWAHGTGRIQGASYHSRGSGATIEERLIVIRERSEGCGKSPDQH